MVKRKSKKQKGGFAPLLAAIPAGVGIAHKVLQKVQPATMADSWLKAHGYETDPNKLSGLKWVSATALKGMREKLGWGMGQSGNVLYGQSGGSIQGEQYGIPNLTRSSPVGINQVMGSGMKKKGRGKGAQATNLYGKSIKC